jgi:hypothetical protein
MLDSKSTHVTTHRASMIERRRAPTSKSVCCGKQVGGVLASKSVVAMSLMLVRTTGPRPTYGEQEMSTEESETEAWPGAPIVNLGPMRVIYYLSARQNARRSPVKSFILIKSARSSQEPYLPPPLPPPGPLRVFRPCVLGVRPAGFFASSSGHDACAFIVPRGSGRSRGPLYRSPI